MKLAKIAVSAAPYAIDLPYTYRIPPDLEDRIQPGMRVVVPFGTANRLCEGMILSAEEGEPEERTKSVLSVLDDRPVLDREGIRLALWMREQFFCTVLHCKVMVRMEFLSAKSEPLCKSVSKIILSRTSG